MPSGQRSLLFSFLQGEIALFCRGAVLGPDQGALGMFLHGQFFPHLFGILRPIGVSRGIVKGARRELAFEGMCLTRRQARLRRGRVGLAFKCRLLEGKRARRQHRFNAECGLGRSSTCDAVINHGPSDLMFGTGCECGGSAHVFSKFGQLRQGVAPFVAAA